MSIKGRTVLDDLIQAASVETPGSEFQTHLTDQQQLSLFRLVAGGCRQPGKHTLVMQLNRPLSEWPGLSTFQRVSFDPITSQAELVAGQDLKEDLIRLRRALQSF